MTIYAYCRISTDDKEQTMETQKDAIERAGFKVDVWVPEDEGTSGTIPALQRKMFGNMYKNFVIGDVLIIKSISRLGRDTIDILSTIRDCKKIGVTVRVMEIGGVDIDSPAGKMIVGVLAGLAEVYIDNLRKEVKEGIARAKSQGVICGRQQTNSPNKIKAILADLQAGVSRMNVAHRHQISEKTVSTYKKQYSCAEAFKELESKWNQLQKQISMKGNS